MQPEQSPTSFPSTHPRSRGPIPTLAETEQRKRLVKALLTLEQPDAARLAPLDRGTRYQTLMAEATAQRQMIQQWLENQGLANEVVRLGTPNTFNVLFICCTPRVVRQLHRAPGVVDVAVARATVRPIDYNCDSAIYGS